MRTLWQFMRGKERRSVQEYIELLTYAGNTYALSGGVGQTTLGSKVEEPIGNFSGYTQSLLKSNPVVWGCILARMSVFSEARFKYRRLVNGRPGEMFGTPDLELLEKPWPDGSTGDLLARMITDVDLGGNFYGARLNKERIARLQPDWVTIIMGSKSKPDAGFGQADVEVLGYSYKPGGPGSNEPPQPFLVENVAHWAPYPDPVAAFRGMPWLTPAVREVMGDSAATEHKLQYLSQGATPNMVVTVDASIGREEFEKWVELFEEEHGGLENAYKTIFLGAGSKVEVVGNDLRKVDFKAIQAIGENRIAVAAGVPGIIVGLSEGLESATYSLPFSESVWTPEGPRPIGEIKPGDKVWTRVGLGYEARKVTWQGCTGYKNVYVVKTKNRTFEATGNHPVMLVDGSYKNVEDLWEGDWVIEPLGLPDLGKTKMPDGSEATDERMRWLGAFIGDGCLNGDHGVRMCIPTADRVRGFYEAIPPRLFTKSMQGQWQTPGRRATDGLTPRMVELRAQGLTYRQIKEKMGVAIHQMSIKDRIHHATHEYRGKQEPVVTGNCRHGFQFHSKQAVKWHHEMGVTGTAKTKRVPGWIFGLRKDLRLAFLAGIVDTDGSIGQDGRLTIHLANRALVEDIRMLLVSVGVQCSNISRRTYRADVLPNKGNQSSYVAWSFVASTAVDVARIPFVDSMYRERVDANRDRRRINTVGYKIRSIEKSDVIQPVYDIEVEGSHNFLADGVVVHNSNYAQAKRRFSDGTIRPLWRGASECLAKLIRVPPGSQLWYDARDIAFLQEDQKDEAEIQKMQATTLELLVKAGFAPESAVEAVVSNDFSRLSHTGLVSVQLQEPGVPPPSANGQGSANGQPTQVPVLPAAK